MYKKVRKYIFIDSHKWLNIIKDLYYFLTKIEKLKSYTIVEFNKYGAIKAKDYLVDYIVRVKKCHQIIIITYDKYTFFVNDKIWKVWTWEEDTFLQSKDWGNEMMISDFLLFFSQFNLALLSSKMRKKVSITKSDFLKIEIVKMFRYRKNNNRYWDRAKLYK